MEPLAAISIAASVIQLVDFGAKTVVRCVEIYSSREGLSRDLVSIEDMSKNLNDLSVTLSSSIRDNFGTNSMSPVDQTLLDLATKCQSTTARLMKILKKVKPSESRSVSRSIRKAFYTAYLKGDIDSVAAELKSYQDALQICIVTDLRSQVNAAGIQNVKSFTKLDNSTRDVLEAILEGRKLFLQQSASLEQLHARMQAQNTSEHQQTQLLIQNVQEELRAGKALPSRVKVDFENDEVQRQLRDTLWFPEHILRQDEITQAHRGTFIWLFDNGGVSSGRWSNFVVWLKEGRGTYWVKAKAGSGKSTLLNFIWEETETQDLLRVWAGDCHLVIACFFFWHAGTQLQQSLSGLLRSLIFQILEAQPSLTEVCFTKEDEVLRVLSLKNGNRSISWTEKRLLHIFRSILTMATGKMKICFIIDGLDESSSDHFDISRLIVEITETEGMKVCMSSRPLNVFETFFETSAKLDLQNITYRDINTYIRDQLTTDAFFRELEKDKPGNAASLINEITNRSSGVFLWTKLVVRSVLEGLQNRDRLEVLLQRVRSLPDDLDALFDRMLHAIEHHSPYFVEAARIFQIMTAITNPGMPPYFEIYPSFSLLELGQALDADLDNLISTQLRPRYTDDVDSVPEISINRPAICTRGLVEVTQGHYLPRARGDYYYYEPDVQSSDYEDRDPDLASFEKLLRGKGSLYGEYKVDFMHKSVRDFLLKDSVWKRISGATSVTNFNAHLALMISAVRQIKTTMQTQQQFDALTKRIFFCARQVEAAQGPSCRIVLDELDRIYGTLLSEHLPRVKLDGCHWSAVLFTTATGLARYMEEKLSLDRPVMPVTVRGRPLLHYCFEADLGPRYSFETVPSSTPSDWYGSGLNTLDMIDVLLRYGADPAYCFQGVTAWELFLAYLFRFLPVFVPARGVDRSSLSKIFAKFIPFGIDLHATIERLGRRTPTGNPIERYSWELTAYAVCAHGLKEQTSEYREIVKYFEQAGAKREMRPLCVGENGEPGEWVPLDNRIFVGHFQFDTEDPDSVDCDGIYANDTPQRNALALI